VDIHGKSVDMDMDMDWKFHIHGKPGYRGSGETKKNTKNASPRC